jgi:hypothetical protein
MKPGRVDFVVDLAYGAMIALSVGLIVLVGTAAGIAFGIGVLVSYVIHIGWKMGRFDPDWMTEEVATRVEETVSEDVERTVSETVSKEVDEVAEQVSEQVTEEVEQTVADKMDAAADNPG